MSIVRWIAPLCLSASLIGAASAQPIADANLALLTKAFLDCKAASLSAFADTQVKTIISVFEKLTAARATDASTAGKCRWEWKPPLANAEVSAAFLEARKQVADLSNGATLWEQDFAKELIARIDEMHAKILLDSTVVDLGDFRLIDSLKALGANPATRLHPVEMALDASATIRGDAAFGNSSTLGDLLGGLRSKADASCGECAERAKELATYFPVFDVLNQARNVVMAPGWGLVGELAAQRFREWDAYHFGGGSARTPMQWELAANGWIYQTFINKDGGKEGPPPAPNWALVLGHPSVGVVPFDSKGAESNVVGAVEGVGFTTWSFDSVTGERTNEWGISAEGVYQPREDANDWSAGVLVRLSFQGINVVWSQPKVSGKREDVFAVSIDITKLFGEGEGQMKIGCLFGFAKC